MNKPWRARLSIVFLTVMALGLPTDSFGQIKVLMSGGFSYAYQELLPEFEKTTGITVSTAQAGSQGDGPNTIGAHLRRGEAADVVIMTREGLAELIAANRIVAGTVVDLAQSPLGMAVRTGALKPDISTVEAFKQTLLRAKSITLISTPGIYMTTKLFPQLGIAGAVAGKITNAGAAGVANGKTELAILPVSELIHAPGVDFMGTIPEEIQYVSVFTAAVVVGSKELETSKQLIAFLSSESARMAIMKSGMEPLGSR
jgi:molybdate transport system substrate-binding protein